MNYKEAIEILKMNKPTSDPRKCGKELCTACDVAIAAMQELQEWHKLGTLEEVREAVEKQKPTKTDVSNTNVGNMWTPADQPPKQGEYLLLSFKNFSVPQVGTYREDKDGSGEYYLGDDEESCSSDGLFVNAWMYLPEPYRE